MLNMALKCFFNSTHFTLVPCERITCFLNNSWIKPRYASSWTWAIYCFEIIILDAKQNKNYVDFFVLALLFKMLYAQKTFATSVHLEPRILTVENERYREQRLWRIGMFRDTFHWITEKRKSWAQKPCRKHFKYRAHKIPKDSRIHVTKISKTKRERAKYDWCTWCKKPPWN